MLKLTYENAERLNFQPPTMWALKRMMFERISVKNLNCPVLIVGGPGSGKSLRSLNYVESIDSEGFDLEKCIFQPLEFLDLISGKTRKLKKGECILWDECGLAISNRRWYTDTNIAINEVLQSFRYRNLGLFMTVPTTNYIDPSVRLAFIARVHTIEYDEKKRGAWMRYYESSHNPIFSKTYNKHIRETRGDDWFVVDTYLQNSPKRSNIRAYEKLKDDYLTEYYDKLGMDMQEEQERAKIDYHKPPNTEDYVDMVLDNLEEFTKDNWGQKYIDLHLIHDDFRNFGVGLKTAMRIKAKVLAELQKKGISYL